jgi:hypothetical protein
MKPDEQLVLGDFAARFAAVIAPQVQPPYLAAAIGMSGAILGLIAEDWDRAAHRRVEENRAIRAIFAQAGGLSLDAALAARLRALARTGDDDLRLSALEAANAILRAALIELHAATEALTGLDAKAVNAAIWKELAASTERRKLSVGSF